MRMESVEAGTLRLYRPEASANVVSRVLAVTRAIGAGMSRARPA